MQRRTMLVTSVLALFPFNAWGQETFVTKAQQQKIDEYLQNGWKVWLHEKRLKGDVLMKKGDKVIRINYLGVVRKGN